MRINMIRPMSGRDPHAGRRVAVYKNLHKGAWSIRALDGPHKGTVVGYAEAVALRDCAMHVGLSAQRRIAEGAPREVHAWVIGRLADDVTLTAPARLTYRPHTRAEFFLADTGQAIHTAAAVLFTDAAYIDAT